jgi:cobyrinic acid a,c-diamide synthase
MTQGDASHSMVGLLIAGTASGVGKTTISLAIIAALRRRGFVVQAFKCGPDFLDTGHQTRMAGRKSRNLDTWMLSHESNREVLRNAARGADALIAEGMMGLFDGKDGDSEIGSSAEIAKLLKLPVVLVVDASTSARSLAAVLHGFESFDPDLPLAGVILNRVGSEAHFRMLEAAIHSRCRSPILGWLPYEAIISIPERHLGLQTAEEQVEFDEQLEALANLAESHLDLDRISGLRCGLNLEATPVSPIDGEDPVRIGVAYDPAFTFYYEDNLDLLRQEGGEIVPFSPLRDKSLPAALDALYLGGGYPELHVGTLSANTSMLSAIRHFASSGRPLYAECGGMMYLASSLATPDGRSHNMAGGLSFSVEMTARLQRFGYVTVEFTRDCLLGPSGTVIRGHSFHHSRIIGTHEIPTSYRIDYSLSGQQEQEGFSNAEGSLLATYVHVHFRANPSVARHFVAAGRIARAKHAVIA